VEETISLKNETKEAYDVIIIGAGPAGCTSAYQLTGKGLKICIIEKNTFPRDKICGDALSPDVVNQLYRIDPKLGERFQQLPKKKATHGIRFIAPNSKQIDINFINPKFKDASGFIVKRFDFDHFMFNQINNLPDVDIFLDHKVESLESLEDQVIIKTDQKVFNAKTVIGADGANSIVSKKLADNQLDKNHHSAGVRQYYENVTGFDHQGLIELHFYKDILPGYFWIFPLENNQANVGLGMVSNEVSKRKTNLRKTLADIIENHPNIKHRFKDAKPMESVKGFGLPMGSKKRPCSGNRFLLIGDAASLIDPFSGEGIGMAIRSGRIAADHLLKAFELNRFDAKFNAQYDKKVYSKMWFELYFGYWLQKLLKYPAAFNFLINLAGKSSSVQTLLTFILDNRDIKNSILSPSFYLKRFSPKSKV
jgi:geranylgeranyl reductase family protein